MANKTQSKGNIYSLAKLAKERLKQNNYVKTKVSTISTANSFYEYISHKKSDEAISKPIASHLSYDEELYKKVCMLLETNYTLNPISHLIDKQLFNSLDVEAKQYYINNLTQKYKYMKNRYYKEHPVSLFL